jgi:ankyrin repeat protein
MTGVGRREARSTTGVGFKIVLVGILDNAVRGFDRGAHWAASLWPFQSTRQDSHIGADVDAIDGDGATALHHAVADDLVDVVELLLSKGASLRVGGKFVGTGNTTLHYAVRLGDPQMVARILARAKDANLDVDAHGSGGWSPLGLAVRVGNTPVVDALLAAGARGDAVMGTGKSPLDIARVNNKLAIIETIEKNQKSA